MKLHSIAFIRAAVLSSSVHFLCASAHTYVWSVWVNGVDQGTGNGIRLPAYNGPAALIGGGYVAFTTNISALMIWNRFANGPVRDITKPEMACNVLGEVPNNATIGVAPGDIVT
jgi:cellulase